MTSNDLHSFVAFEEQCHTSIRGLAFLSCTSQPLAPISIDSPTEVGLTGSVRADRPDTIRVEHKDLGHRPSAWAADRSVWEQSFRTELPIGQNKNWSWNQDQLKHGGPGFNGATSVVKQLVARDIWALEIS